MITVLGKSFVDLVVRRRELYFRGSANDNRNNGKQHNVVISCQSCLSS